MKEEKLKISEYLYKSSVGDVLSYGKVYVEEIAECFKKYIAGIREWYPNGAISRYEDKDITMSFEYEYGYYNDCTYEVTFYGNRLETDEEFAKRLKDRENHLEAVKKAGKIRVEANKKRERTLYEKLKQKFEKQ